MYDVKNITSVQEVCEEEKKTENHAEVKPSEEEEKSNKRRKAF